MQTVHIKLTNRWATFVGGYPRDILDEYFSFHPPNYRWMPAYRNGYWDGLIRLLRYNRISTGLFLALRDEITAKAHITFDVDDQRIKIPFIGATSDPDASVRDYQAQCVERMVESASVGAGGLVYAATGSGKTFTIGTFFKRLPVDASAVFVVNELTLLDQAHKELGKVMDQRIGTIGDSVFAPKRITVATVQTMALHAKDPKFKAWFKALTVVVVDEFHEALNKRMLETLRAMTPAAVFGLTATLELEKPHVRLPAFSIAGPVIFEYSLAEGIKNKVLAPGIVIGVQIPQYQDTGTYQQQYTEQIVHNDYRNSVAEILVREAYRRKKHIVVLVERVEHLRILSKLLEDIPHSVVFGGVKAHERVETKKQFAKDKIRVIIANKVFKKGVDLPKIDVIIDATAAKSRNDTIQKYGRGTRQSVNKLGLLFFDLMDYTADDAVRKTRFRHAALERVRAYRKRNLKVFKTALAAGFGAPDVMQLYERAEAQLRKEAAK